MSSHVYKLTKKGVDVSIGLKRPFKHFGLDFIQLSTVKKTSCVLKDLWRKKCFYTKQVTRLTDSMLLVNLSLDNWYNNFYLLWSFELDAKNADAGYVCPSWVPFLPQTAEYVERHTLIWDFRFWFSFLWLHLVPWSTVSLNAIYILTYGMDSEPWRTIRDSRTDFNQRCKRPKVKFIEVCFLKISRFFWTLFIDVSSR